MNIRTKFQLVVLLIPVLLISSIAGYCYLVLIPEYRQVEVSRVVDKMDHVRDIYEYMIENLDSVNWDWASWDAMYEYVNNPNQTFIESNYVVGSFIDNKIHIMIITDVDGKILFGKYVDLETYETKDIHSEIFDHLRENCLYNSSGTLILDDFVAIYSGRPILASNGEGPALGSHIMIRIIDSYFTEELSLLTQQNVQFEVVEDPLSWDIIIATQSEDLMKASSLIIDNHNQNTIQVSLLYERSIFQRSTQNMQALIIYLIIFGTVFIGISHYLAEVLVLRRLTVLSNELGSLSGKADPTLRISEAGDDEIGEVTKNVNRLLNRLEAAQIVESLQRDKIEEIRQEHYLDLIDSVKKISERLNNDMTKPLSSAKNVAYLLRQDGNNELAEMLESSLNQGERVVFELSSMISISEVRKTVSDLNEVLESAVLSVPKPNNITIETKLGETFLAVLLDVSKMTRVFENIITNAIESMPRGGIIIITTEQDESGVSIHINDTGKGMSFEEQDNLFKPFYTNKKDSIGFGLVYAKQVVEGHNGSISITSEKGEGTTVSIFIPREKTENF